MQQPTGYLEKLYSLHGRKQENPVKQTYVLTENMGSGERLGNRAINQKVVGSIPGCAKQKNYVVSLGKALHPYLPRGEYPLLSVALDKSVCKMTNVNVM